MTHSAGYPTARKPQASSPVLPRAGASWPPPPEVEVDYHRHQVLALTTSGEPFTQYVECSAGCGYVIGCGDAIESIAHVSCSAKEATVPAEPHLTAERLIEVTIGLWSDDGPPATRPPRLAAAIVNALRDEGYAITREALCARSGGCRD